MKEGIKVNLDGKIGMVDREAYVKAKTKQLREFGYPTLTEDETDAQVSALLDRKEFGKGLTVIGMFMEGEIVT